MTAYYLEKENRIVLFDTDKERLENTLPFVPQYAGLEIQETDGWIVDGEILNKEEYEAYLEKQERERTDALTVTKRVFALALQELGISYTQLKELIATNEQAQLEWDLCVELKRGNPLLDIMAAQAGISSEQVDEIFIKANA